MGGISVLNKDGSVIPDIFREVNHRPLGDVAQSITKINGKYFVTLDNSKKIEVIDPETFGSVGTILYTQAGFPRQIVAISPTEAIVSDLERQLVRIRTVEPYGEPLEYISIPRSVEYLVTVDNKIFGMTTGGIYVFDTDNISKKAVRVIPEVKNDENTKTAAEKKKLLAAGFVCGTLLFAASAAQQIGITINPSTAKAGFLTAMYVVLVPVFGLFLGRKGSAQLWVSMVVAVLGLYLLCMKNGFGSIESSDWLLLSCAVLFSFQIIAVDHFSPQVDGVRLSLAEFLVVSVESTAAALLFETPSAAQFAENALPILYCGIMSSGVAYTLQILGQRDLNPAIASLIMCLESVFSALGGWMLLHQNLSAREVFGCVLIFAAVVLAQLPLEMLHRAKKTT